MIRSMDLFDGEPYLGLAPRRWLRPFGYAALIVLAMYSPARLWLIDQAERHVHHEVQPMIDRLVEQSRPAENSRSISGAFCICSRREALAPHRGDKTRVLVVRDQLCQLMASLTAEARRYTVPARPFGAS